jgi:hypothetical protein
MYIPECKKWPQLNPDRLISVNDGEPDQQLLFIMNEETLLLHENIPHPVGHAGDILYVKVFNILVAFGTVIIPLILADARIEALAVADHGGIKTRQKNMPLATESINGTDKQSVIFSCVTTDNGGGRIAAGSVGSQYLTAQGILKIYYMSLIKFNISHSSRSSV